VFTNRRVLEPVEARLMTSGGALLLILAALFAVFPRVLVSPLCMMFVWLGVALLYRSSTFHREGKREKG
jgi:cardiolipin synthase A/B